MAIPLASGGMFPVQPTGKCQRFGWVDQTAIGTKPTGNLFGLQEVKMLEFTASEDKGRKDRLDKNCSPSLFERYNGKRGVTWNLRAYAMTGEALGTAPDIGGVLDAAGFSETPDPGVKVRYAPDSVITPMLLVMDNESYGEYLHDAIVTMVKYTFSGGDAAFIDLEGIASYKAIATRTLVNGAEAAGQTLITVDDTTGFEADCYVQGTGDANGGNAGYRVTQINSATTLTVSPALAVGWADDAQVGPIFTPSSTVGTPIDGNSGSITIGGTTYVVIEGSVSIEAVVQDNRDNFGTAIYTDAFYIQRRVKGTVTAKLNRSNQILATLGRSNASRAVVLTIGSTSTEKIEITMPYCDLLPVASVDIPEEEAIQITFEFMALASSGDDEIQIDYK